MTPRREISAGNVFTRVMQLVCLLSLLSCGGGGGSNGGSSGERVFGGTVADGLQESTFLGRGWC